MHSQRANSTLVLLSDETIRQISEMCSEMENE